MFLFAFADKKIARALKKVPAYAIHLPAFLFNTADNKTLSYIYFFARQAMFFQLHCWYTAYCELNGFRRTQRQCSSKLQPMELDCDTKRCIAIAKGWLCWTINLNSGFPMADKTRENPPTLGMNRIPTFKGHARGCWPDLGVGLGKVDVQGTMWRSVYLDAGQQ